jgi:hypothetical protein
MTPNKVVVKFKDNSVIKGKTSDFFPNKAQFHLEEINGEISDLKTPIAKVGQASRASPFGLARLPNIYL